jgi:hypothetical protein
MHRSRAALAALLCAALAGAPAARAQDGGGLGGGGEKLPNDPNAPLPVRVNQAIDSGVRWLMDKDDKRDKVIFPPGNWNDEVQGDRLYDPESKGDVYTHPTGCTALSLYALLKSGVPKDDPAIKRGFDWLKKTTGGITKGKANKTAYRIPNGTYELAVLILAVEARANPVKREAQRERELKFRLKKGEKLKLGVKLEAEDAAWMKELVDALRKRWNTGKGWRYGHWNGQKFDNGPRGDSDLSASNLAMLAFLAAERCGFSQPDDFYASVLRWTLSLQQAKAEDTIERWDPARNKEDDRYSPQKDEVRGFGYLGSDGSTEEHRPTGSMTCCGLANIVICSSILEARESKAYDAALQAAAEKGWWDGVAWLDYHWTVQSNPNDPGYHYYYLYCLERACDMKRINLIAGKPWYNLGAQVLVDAQQAGGFWDPGNTHRPRDVINTCFALLFLNRSTPAITGDD